MAVAVAREATNPMRMGRLVVVLLIRMMCSRRFVTNLESARQGGGVDHATHLMMVVPGHLIHAT